MGASGGVAGLAATDPSWCPTVALTAAFYTAIGCPCCSRRRCISACAAWLGERARPGHPLPEGEGWGRRSAGWSFRPLSRRLPAPGELYIRHSASNASRFGSRSLALEEHHADMLLQA